MDKIKEIRKETCTVATKLVVVTLYRLPGSDKNEGEIVGFECDSSSSTCEAKCLYRLLLEDY